MRILTTTLQNQHNFTIHVISIQEAWLTEGRPINEIEIDNYEMIYELNRIGGPKGGIVVYVHDSLKGSKNDFFKKFTMKSLGGSHCNSKWPTAKEAPEDTYNI